MIKARQAIHVQGSFVVQLASLSLESSLHSNIGCLFLQSFEPKILFHKLHAQVL